jgi:uncharacterized repeat protein (TIGR01451 family)
MDYRGDHVLQSSGTSREEKTMRIRKSVMCRAAQLALLLVLTGIGSGANLWAATYSDPCTSALPIGSATGCGALITVTAVDGNGNAIAFTVTIPNNGNGAGNGNPYDGTEDTLVGVINSSGGPMMSMTLTATDTTFGGIFHFDQDGPCGYRRSNNDCFNGAEPGVDPGDYQGPNNTFTVGAGTPCASSGTCYTSGTVNFITPIPTGGSTWFALEGLPQSLTEITQTGQPINPGSPANLSQSFVFNNTPNQHVEIDFDYTKAFNTNSDLMVVDDTVPTVANQGISHAAYASMVAGTSLAMTDCFTAIGEGTDASGNPLCAQMTITCTNASSNIPLGDNCPQSAERNLYWAQLLNTPGSGINTENGITIPSGTAPVLPEGSDHWSSTPGSCVFIGPEAGSLCPQSTLTQFELVTTDNGPKGGGGGTTTNSSFVAGCCEIEWNTVANVPTWWNKTTVPVSFTAKPPTPANPTNNWVAAPNASITIGEENLGATPDTTFPVAGDQTFPNPAACPSAWPTPGTVPPSFTAGGNVTVPGEGYFEVHYFSTACDNQEELAFPTTAITTGSTTNLATFKTAPFSVDLTSPTVTITLNPSSGIVAQNSTGLSASVTCFDPSSSVVRGLFSGIAQCGSQSAPQIFSGQQTVTTTAISLSTTTLGTNTFTAIAKDVAGNSTTASVNYQVVGPDNLAIVMFSNLKVKTGTNLNYYIFVVNGGPNAANLTTVTDTLPAGTSLVSSGYAIDSCTFTKGQPPSCSITAPTTSCGSVPPGSCSIGTLPAWTSQNAIGAVVQITVNVTANPNTIIKNTASVSGANTNTDVKFTSASWPTLVTK